jgi:hypothetical protein
LSSQPDHSDGSGTLPAAELNPLLNPVLGQNMGRWAEVYFTSPPEKREQAVLELLRELRAENPELAGTVVSAPSAASAHVSQPWNVGAAQSAAAQQPSIVCRGCGRENPGSHRFCGMCGKLLGEAEASADPPIGDIRNIQVAEPQLNLHATDFQMAHAQTAGFHISDLHIEDQDVKDRHIEDRHIEDGHTEDRPRDGRAGFPHETQFIHSEKAVFEPALNTNELSLFQGGSESSYSDGQSEAMFLDSPPPRRYRVYVGIALAIVISVLGYMAWHSSQAESQNARVESPAPPAVTAPAATSSSAAPSPAKPDAPDETSSANQPAAVASNRDRTNAERASANQSSDAGRNTTEVAARSAAAANPSTDKKTPAEVLGGNGAEELAMAQRYLDGTGGQERNPAEAAQWLWKAMAKHNAKAPLLLADLYLKGEGVSKNCDQARVLLDSATRAGVKDAAERLRHLQAFGCQ